MSYACACVCSCVCQSLVPLRIEYRPGALLTHGMVHVSGVWCRPWIEYRPGALLTHAMVHVSGVWCRPSTFRRCCWLGLICPCWTRHQHGLFRTLATGAPLITLGRCTGSARDRARFVKHWRCARRPTGWWRGLNVGSKRQHCTRTSMRNQPIIPSTTSTRRRK